MASSPETSGLTGSPAVRRAAAVERTIEQVRALVSDCQDVGIATSQGICDLMGRLAADSDLWVGGDFPVPEDKLWQAYQLHEDPDGSYAMYAVAMKPGHQQPPHNHTTWAAIAGVRGSERNTLYVREPAEPHPRVRHLIDINVDQGRVIAMGPDDVHSIEVLGPDEALHLHLYGKGFAHLNDRRIFDLESGEGRPFPTIQGIK
ncbi:hypothetical protein [Ottowia thiooxydans]|uniref:cysteine dioxygenase family protein n=1 Tax=Ottowia thiooxydans TaxID=219182 RepID=UPI0003FC617D|nr:hypothetical protein [Ottowia thiooxydans]